MNASDDFPRNPANHVPLSPLGFIERAARTYPDRLAMVHGPLRRTWRETWIRCRRLASSLQQAGVSRGDTVAVMAANGPELYEAHFGVPMCGAVLSALNTRLDAPTLAFILDHGEAKILFTDREYSATMRDVLSRVKRPIRVIDIDDPCFTGDGECIGECDYESFLDAGDPEFEALYPPDEWDSLCLNYTSGTTGNPKGVLYHHRGAYLNAMGNMVATGMRQHATYLWTLPMFHCNGWCYPWTMALIAGTNVFLRRVEPRAIFAAIRDHHVDYFCAAPVVLTMLANAPENDRFQADWTVEVLTGGAPPPAATIAAMDALGIQVNHLYGLTETFGPAVLCSWQDKWDTLPLAERAAIKSRIGVRKHTLDHVRVIDSQTMLPVPANGQSLGEIMIRGNTVMKGYLKNAKATAEAFADGWFHTGDIAVVHPDGYLQIKDRAKDIVISGGENISTVEVEDVLYRHPDILEAAVVARPDPKWGETPCAFVTLKDGRRVSVDDIIGFCRGQLAGFKIPRTIVFGVLPKTSTGKIQKFLLREAARAIE